MVITVCCSNLTFLTLSTNSCGFSCERNSIDLLLNCTPFSLMAVNCLKASSILALSDARFVHTADSLISKSIGGIVYILIK